MSVNSLSNFGVPGYGGERGVVLEPFKSSHWRITVFGFGASNQPAPYDITRMAKSVSLPKFRFSEAPLRMYVSTVYIMTRAEWDTISITFSDDIKNSVFGRVINQAYKQFNFYDQTMSRAGENYKFEMEIDFLAGGATAGGTASDPNVLRKYSLSGCWITAIDDPNMSYDDSNPKTFSTTIRFDNAIVYNHNGVRMGSEMSHSSEIQTQNGSLSTGIGFGGPSGGGIGGFVGVSGSFGFGVTF